ncbi:hypothetical protein TTHERM_00538830 (macronuclear) [Tetrahymena thermophila SB210]|uniref:Uncharacterized protein n=1 Tax=Tetrahymena thermophila (strain SB210) TaxID=312017 RepID=I7MHL1_TETTS|nr:hypothetical protein TTHERM_00538830 [Tetrahymena thermophila SB210]EAR87662.1 hypothetical protein TTHERM_00538830 [Tetrahymena thermophila SB210]|eukprot:XP_001007907.1 hypothetical protein TTHERM_00538830 [Tetrahymena thermophila SB210]
MKQKSQLKKKKQINKSQSFNKNLTNIERCEYEKRQKENEIFINKYIHQIPDHARHPNSFQYDFHITI